ncbi:MAG: hypothetical protein JM57_01755 [Comamonadaceae bacterium BICA1-1]|nr:MAG: hypothetical protein JM57_01755 [Comamonadaceae bacterium BICA1-1]
MLSTHHCAHAGFEAARQLHRRAPQHPQARLHGHSFEARLRARVAPGWAAVAGTEVEQLQQHLAGVTAALDHRLLNDCLPEPDDTALARWLHERLLGEGLQLAQIGVQSTPRSGCDLDAAGHAHTWRRYRFEAAHQLPRVPAGHKCGRMHGHGFEVLLHARPDGLFDELGSADRLERAWAPLQQRLHRHCLNDIAGLENPTSEVLSAWLWQQLVPALPGLSRVTVFETASCGASFDGQRYRIWKDLTLDSARRLRLAPPDHPLAALYGHTYTLRLGLGGALDAVQGWVLDFGDVKRLFDPLFKALDHQPLHELAAEAGLPDCDCASLAGWILQQGRRELAALEQVDLYQTPGCGAVVAAHEPGLSLL